MPNGAIYIIDVGIFLQNEKFLTSKTIPFSMSDESSIDIDTLEDLQTIESLLI